MWALGGLDNDSRNNMNEVPSLHHLKMSVRP
jgi:hypothetical protein